MVSLPRATLIAAGIVAVFFAATAVLPLSTMGDPSYDIPMLRTRWFGQFGVVWSLLFALLSSLLLAVLRRSLAAVGAAVALLAVGYAMVTEEGRFIEYGLLIGAHDEAMVRLAWARGVTLALSLAAVALLWRVDVRR